MTTPNLPSDEELGEVRLILETLNGTIAKLYGKYGDTIKIMPYVNYSDGVYAEFRVTVSHKLAEY